MKEKITGKKLAKNVVVSVFAQIISLLVGFLVNLIVPKFIAESSYANWQTFVLYSSFVGVLHFGLLDGFVLRYSKYDYDELDKPLIRSQFQLLLIFHFILNALILIDAKRIAIKLWEYGSQEVNAYSTTNYDITILDDNGNKHYTNGTMYKN